MGMTGGQRHCPVSRHNLSIPCYPLFWFLYSKMLMALVGTISFPQLTE